MKMTIALAQRSPMVKGLTSSQVDPTVPGSTRISAGSIGASNFHPRNRLSGKARRLFNARIFMLNNSKPAIDARLLPFYTGALSEFRGTIEDAMSRSAQQIANSPNRGVALWTGQKSLVDEVFPKFELLVTQVIGAHLHVGERDISGISEKVARELVDVAWDDSSWGTAGLFAIRGIDPGIAHLAKQVHRSIIQGGQMRLRGSLQSRVGAAILKLPKQTRYDRIIEWAKDDPIISWALCLGLIGGMLNSVASLCKAPIRAIAVWLSNLI
jgi:hypothetical protein